MTKAKMFTIGIATLLFGACAEFDPDLSGIENSDPDPGSGSSSSSDPDSGSDDGGNTSDGGETGANTNGGSGDADGDTDEGTSGGVTSNPGPDELCDPFLAAEGVAPCEDPGEFPQTYTCAPLQLMSEPGEASWEFRCLLAKDTNGDGWDPGNPCNDDGGVWSNTGSPVGCVNAWCLHNGLGNDPETDEHINFAPDECLFQTEVTGPYVTGCCSPYCDAGNPCDPGWTCQPLNQGFINIESDVGTCLWNG